MSCLWLKVTAEGGCIIGDALKDAKRIADLLRVTVSFEFNGRTIIVNEDTNIYDFLEKWYA